MHVLETEAAERPTAESPGTTQEQQAARNAGVWGQWPPDALPLRLKETTNTMRGLSRNPRTPDGGIRTQAGFLKTLPNTLPLPPTRETLRPSVRHE